MKKSRIILAAAVGAMLAQSASAAYTNVLIDATTHNGSFENGLVFETGKTDRGFAVDEWALTFSGYWARFTLGSYVPESATDGNIGVTFNNGVEVTVSSDTIYQALNSNDVLTLTLDMVARNGGGEETTAFEAFIQLDGQSTYSFGSQLIPASGSGQYSGQLVLPKDCLFYSIKIVAGTTGQNCFDNVALTRVGDLPLASEAVFTTFMGKEVCNGGFQTNDPVYAWTDSTRTNPVPSENYFENTTGRRMIAGQAGNWILDFNGWSARRTYYKGGNDAWGIDGAAKGDLAGYPNTYYFMNSGDSTLTSSNCPIDLFNGDSVMVQFDMMTAAIPVNDPTNIPANCAGMIIFNDGAFTNSWAADETYVTNVLQTTTFTKSFQLANDVTNMQVVLYFSTGRGYDSRFTEGSSNQAQLDNVRVLGFKSSGGKPINIISFMPMGGDVYKLEVEIAGADRAASYPVASGNLLVDPWAQVPHSDDGVNAFVTSNLLYSTESGSNRVIYVQSADAAKFFGIKRN